MSTRSIKIANTLCLEEDCRIAFWPFKSKEDKAFDKIDKSMNSFGNYIRSIDKVDLLKLPSDYKEAGFKLGKISILIRALKGLEDQLAVMSEGSVIDRRLNSQLKNLQSLISSLKDLISIISKEKEGILVNQLVLSLFGNKIVAFDGGISEPLEGNDNDGYAHSLSGSSTTEEENTDLEEGEEL